MKNTTYFFKDKPIFGFDLGYDNLKVIQIESHGSKQIVGGYGSTTFEPKAYTDGVITDPEAIAQSAYQLFKTGLVGDISTRRVVMSVPAARTFTRTMHLPVLKTKDIVEAVSLEAEQYIPVPIGELYLDHMVIGRDTKGLDVLAVAVPKKIIDSYVVLADILGLEPVGIETSIGAASRLFKHAEKSDGPTVLIDFGSVSSDITIYDNGIVVTGTASGGGDSFTDIIAKTLGMSPTNAAVIKTKYGLGVSKKQREINEAVKPVLEELIKEVRRMIRYFEDRSTAKRKITQVITMGGGANMPGLSEFMTSSLRMPVRMCDPWQKLDFGKLKKPSGLEKTMYTTATGLALLEPKEIFA